MSPLRVLAVAGCRPNFVKLGPLMAEMRRRPEIEPLLVHTGQHYDRELSDLLFRDLDLPANPSLYVHAPARLDPSMAPAGQDTVIGIVPVGHMSENGEQDWAKIRDRARQHVFRRLRTLGVTDLEEHIKFEVNYTPLSWRKR